MNRRNIKKQIEHYKLFRNGLHKSNGSEVRAVNLKLPEISCPVISS